MERIPKGIYTPEFRAEAVKLVEKDGLSVPKSSLGNWVRASRVGKLATVGQGQRVPTETEVELARLRKELAEVKLERDLLEWWQPTLGTVRIDFSQGIIATGAGGRWFAGLQDSCKE